MELPLIHGVLHATIYEALQLIHKHPSSGCFHSLATKLCRCCSINVCHYSHLFVTLDLGDATVARTCIVKRHPYNLSWNETFHVYCAHEARHLIVTIRDQVRLGPTIVVGKAEIPLSYLILDEAPEQELEQWFDVFSQSDATLWQGKIRLRLSFSPATKDPHWGVGITPSNDFNGVPFTFFPLQKGNRVRLYQDAHSSHDYNPNIRLEGGKAYEVHSCWEDMYKAMVGAKHLIYIAGWSVFTQITLVCERGHMIAGAPEGLTLGELLKKKSKEGVRVLVLIWDDLTSIPVLKENGLMETHDEDTEIYFKGSHVHCVKCPRNPDDGASMVNDFRVGLMFTHHQKSVTVDVEIEAASEKRQLVSFMGGIDLCDGRYDTQEHSLFKTLNSVHMQDFRQASIHGANLHHGGPREPWHDVHSRLEGPVAWDVLFNFEQRWKKQGKRRCLLPINQISNNILGPTECATSEDDTDTWNSQLFRSIDEGGAFGFPKDPDVAALMGLMKGKEDTIDRSIQDAYIQAIRRAKNFIYMENQYFIGSAASWEFNRDSGALQLVPMELALKIISKIESGERFAVYVVIPMWPEGEPESSSVQAILYWQRLTMTLMYSRITRALRRVGSSASPCDYLNFFCLGNRERWDPEAKEYIPQNTPDHDSNYGKAQEHRRFMIYVHSKTMIVDDEYILVGSANCNQRSMDGARDSEIVHGSYQPHHLISGSKFGGARGQVHGFRMSLWYEHTGKLDDSYLQPESLECVEKMRKWSHERWEKFVQKEVVDLHGHLLPYPIYVDPESGTILDLSGFENFPDTKAPVRGSKSSFLPSLLTV